VRKRSRVRKGPAGVASAAPIEPYSSPE